MSNGLKIWNAAGVPTLDTNSFLTRFITTFVITPNGAQTGSVYIPELVNAVGTPWAISYMTTKIDSFNRAPAVCTISGATLYWQCSFGGGTRTYAPTRVMVGVF
jgi:hypothetical protein